MLASLYPVVTVVLARVVLHDLRKARLKMVEDLRRHRQPTQFALDLVVVPAAHGPHPSSPPEPPVPYIPVRPLRNGGL